MKNKCCYSKDFLTPCILPRWPINRGVCMVTPGALSEIYDNSVVPQEEHPHKLPSAIPSCPLAANPAVILCGKIYRHHIKQIHFFKSNTTDWTSVFWKQNKHCNHWIFWLPRGKQEFRHLVFNHHISKTGFPSTVFFPLFCCFLASSPWCLLFCPPRWC